ncbi:fluoride efflux transporter FluC [Nocardioides sp.]|uniref:fluoride efflux transporter FluC n=1 Tax=Nocardioides sp. TaxID=35761 RepID=UPI003D0B25BF
MTGLLVALGAGLGAPLRFLIGVRFDRPAFALGTLLVNVLGSFLLGVFSALTLGGHAFAFLGTGFCGGFTTYSAFAVKTVEHGWRTGAAYAVLSVSLALAACALGFWVAQA